MAASRAAVSGAIGSDGTPDSTPAPESSLTHGVCCADVAPVTVPPWASEAAVAVDVALLEWRPGQAATRKDLQSATWAKEASAAEAASCLCGGTGSGARWEMLDASLWS